MAQWGFPLYLWRFYIVYRVGEESQIDEMEKKVELRVMSVQDAVSNLSEIAWFMHQDLTAKLQELFEKDMKLTRECEELWSHSKKMSQKLSDRQNKVMKECVEMWKSHEKRINQLYKDSQRKQKKNDKEHQQIMKSLFEAVEKLTQKDNP